MLQAFPHHTWLAYSPSARIPHKIAKLLGFEDNEVFMSAGYLSDGFPIEIERHGSYSHNEWLDPYVANVLAQEPVEVQRAIIGILNILRSLTKSIENNSDIGESGHAYV